MCVVFSSHSFWTSSSLDVPAGVTQEEGHTGFLIHLPSAVLCLLNLGILIGTCLLKSAPLVFELAIVGTDYAMLFGSDVVGPIFSYVR